MKYDIFLSYRRKTGKNYARTLKPELEKRGFKVFLDLDELKDGVFNQRIKDAINNSAVFLMILSEGALDRCVNEGDWVREEILYAHEKKKHIVPVEIDKSFREIPDHTPLEIKNILISHQFSQIDTETLLEVSLDKMVKERIAPHIKQKPSTSTKGAEIHINVDTDCEIYRFKKLLLTASAGEDNVMFLIPGKHILTYSSKRYPNVKITQNYNVPSDNYSDIIEIKLKDKEKDLEKFVTEGQHDTNLEISQEKETNKKVKKKGVHYNCLNIFFIFTIAIFPISFVCGGIMGHFYSFYDGLILFISTLSLLIPFLLYGFITCEKKAFIIGNTIILFFFSLTILLGYDDKHWGVYYYSHFFFGFVGLYILIKYAVSKHNRTLWLWDWISLILIISIPNMLLYYADYIYGEFGCASPCRGYSVPFAIFWLFLFIIAIIKKV